jgi:hypothetical protein
MHRHDLILAQGTGHLLQAAGNGEPGEVEAGGYHHGADDVRMPDGIALAKNAIHFVASELQAADRTVGDGGRLPALRVRRLATSDLSAVVLSR